MSTVRVGDDTAKKEFFSKYIIKEPNFASGSYGQIILAKDLSSQKVVIKMIPTSVSKKWIHNEIESTKRLTNLPNIVNYRETLSTSNFHYLVFDYASGMELYELLEMHQFKPIREIDAKEIFSQIACTLQLIRKNGIAHRDIKLENILVDTQMKITLLDFGLCYVSSPEATEHKSEEFVGSENYTAPEILSRAPYDPFKVDIWSSAIVLYSLLFGQFPWDNSWRISQMNKTKEHPKLRFPKVAVSDSAKDLLMKMLTVDPKQRISIEGIMSHDWLRDFIQSQ